MPECSETLFVQLIKRLNASAKCFMNDSGYVSSDTDQTDNVLVDGLEDGTILFM